MAQKPRLGGHTWVFLQYLLGFGRLGWDVLFIDRLGPGTAFDDHGRPCSLEESVGARFLQHVMARFALGASFAVLGDGGRAVAGLPHEEVLERVSDSTLLLNFMGFLSDNEILGRARRCVFVDIDPGFPQMWRELGLHDAFVGHDDFVTVGANIGRLGCEVPTCGLPWIPIRPPVVLEHWTPDPAPADGPITSVATWRGAYGPVEYRGRTYGPRAHEFRRFADIPRRSGGRFELALDIHRADISDVELLESGGWSLIDPFAAAGDPWTYRDFIRGSAAEFMVAKGMYVGTRSGWFSDRSACYLASGRPVLMQDTGVESLYPVGKGLITFETPEDALRGIQEIGDDYKGHSRAARQLAEEFFDSDIVLSGLLSSLGID
jgi:hypothetical protein